MILLYDVIITCIHQQDAFSCKSIDIDLTDQPVVQFDIPGVENTFADDCKSMIKMINFR